ncbi:hypothetical protein HDV01_001217 [Terramyces sp. JEL0728]|nr:hypothetical protein HDV01_001217 [Terramyces sp. JEL0728]
MDETDGRKIKTTIRQIKAKLKSLKTSVEQRPSEREKLVLTFKTKQAKLKFTSPSRRLWDNDAVDLGQLSSFAVGNIMNYYNELNQEEIYEMIPIYYKKNVLFQHIISVIVQDCPLPAILLSLGQTCLERKAVNQGFQLIKSYWLKTKNLNKMDSKSILSLAKQHQYEGNWLNFLISIYLKRRDYKLFEMVGQENTLFVLNQLFLQKEIKVILDRIFLLNQDKQENYQLDERYKNSKENIINFIRKLSLHIESTREEAFIIYLYSFDLDKLKNLKRMAKISIDYDYLANFTLELADINSICAYIQLVLGERTTEQEVGPDRTENLAPTTAFSDTEINPIINQTNNIQISENERKDIEKLGLLLSVYLANNLRQSESTLLDIAKIENYIRKLQSNDNPWKFEPLVDTWISSTPLKPKPRMYTSLNELLDVSNQLFTPSQTETKDDLVATPYFTPVKTRVLVDSSPFKAPSPVINFKRKTRIILTSSPIKSATEDEEYNTIKHNIFDTSPPNDSEEQLESPFTDLPMEKENSPRNKKGAKCLQKDSEETLVNDNFDLFTFCDENDFDPLTAQIKKRKENQSTPSIKKLKQTRERYRKPLLLNNESEDELLQ